jgi:hypothetical protein
MLFRAACCLLLGGFAGLRAESCYAQNNAFLTFASTTWESINQSLSDLAAMGGSLGSSEKQRLISLQTRLVKLESEKRDYIARLKKFQVGDGKAAEINRRTRTVAGVVRDASASLGREARSSASLATSPAFQKLNDALVTLREEKESLCDLEDTGDSRESVAEASKTLDAELEQVQKAKETLAALISR